MRKKTKKTVSRVNRVGGDRACLCKDRKTYDKKCCTGETHAQGIGSV